MAEWRRGPILGRGSSAIVSLATSSLSGELIAVKSAELSKSDLLKSEQSIHSSLNCPQIISYIGFEITSLHYNLFIEYAPGGSLSDNLFNRDGLLDDVTIRSHTQEILAGLTYLHSHNLVHCDIKPDNILIGSDGHIKIADLGSARWINQDDDTVRNQIRGTPMFMAPEVARGEEQGPAADVWALGCTVLAMATGRPPWPQSDPIAALHRIAFSQVVPMIPCCLSDEGRDFLTKCLVRDPSQRWTADQLLKHPFVDLASAKQKSNSSNSSWRSPQSILDRDIWDSETEEEEHIGTSDDHIRERIQGLVSRCNGGPNWAWDDSWTTIRSNTDGFPVAATAEDEDEATDIAAQTISIIFSSTEDDENLFFQSHNLNLFHDISDEILGSKKENEAKNVDVCKRYLTSISNKKYVSEKSYHWCRA